MQGLVEILVLPLLGAATITAFKGLMPKKLPGIWASFLVVVSFILSILADSRVHALGASHRVFSGVLWNWATGFGPTIHFRLYLDPLSAVWLLIITGVGALIHIYSIGYMHDDAGEARFFSYLNFFIFSMLLLVLAGNLIVLLIGWALVGLASYFLIGFWYERPTAVAAAKKAFVMNTLGDIGILLGLALLYIHYHGVGYTHLFQAFSTAKPGSAFFEWSAFLLYVGAMAKSAQFPLHMWLADAMEGPTPVSALIHAATMVTAGVYLMARLYPLLRLAPVTHELIGLIGAFTAIFAASVAFFQQDIKKVLAYSTLSQLGYMFLGIGVSAYTASVFHFMTHAFFKACLFLAAGSVIHALQAEQDLSQMGGLWKKMPWTMASFLAATLAISGIPPFSGYFSKEAILGQAYNSGHYFIWGIGVFTAGMTTFYMFRLFFLTFFGKPRNQHLYDHAHEAPLVMTIPVVILGVLSTIGGFFGGWLNGWLAPAFRLYPGASHAALESGPMFGTIITVALAVIAFIVAYLLYIRRDTAPKAGTNQAPGLWMLKAWGMDAVWMAIVVNPLKVLGDGMLLVERAILGGVAGIAVGIQAWASDLAPIQTGYVRRYALSIMVGGVALLAYYLIRVGFIS
ncbi:NADH-quinone oxidoreductase subunit L [Sulfobacillus harzensis]|uniref:NADH-quinone oxidoreductase subunit L n=1 Tax=Sulfobacillus harzensis TaxID=2729629 RepID=A0A7Y0Q376_9FIRM|nr:NADH-quinone oxidoreductase subunit L [Sulfobacillus harzensis]NMP22681.1 NADH-quinone oxidoreductase subunit L [Sulfobacillus harzensis]